MKEASAFQNLNPRIGFLDGKEVLLCFPLAQNHHFGLIHALPQAISPEAHRCETRVRLSQIRQAMVTSPLDWVKVASSTSLWKSVEDHLTVLERGKL
jgi:hypothetical protein